MKMSLNLFLILLVVSVLLSFLVNGKELHFEKKANVFKVNSNKSNKTKKIVMYMIFLIGLVYLFVVTKSYLGSSLFISVPFTLLAFYPIFNSIKNINRNNLLEVNYSLGEVIINYTTFEIKDVVYVKLVEQTMNANENIDYSLAIMFKKRNEVDVLTIENKNEILLIVRELKNKLGVPVKYFLDQGVIGVKEVSRL